MIRDHPKDFGALYLGKTSIAASLFSLQNSKLRSTYIANYTLMDTHRVGKAFQNCFTILTNGPQSPFFKLVIEQSRSTFAVNPQNEQQQQEELQKKYKMVAVEEKSLQQSTIENYITNLPMQNLEGLSNCKTILKSAKSQAERFKVIGMLLCYLVNQAIIENHQNSDRKLFFEDIQFNVDSIFYNLPIKREDLEFLEITREQVHPSLLKGKGRSKQGFSLMNLYESCVTSATAKKIMRQRLTNPTFDKNMLENRYYTTQWIKKHFDVNNYKNFIKIFKGLHCVQVLFKKFTQSTAEEQDWKKLINILSSLIDLFEVLTIGCHKSKETIPDLITQFVEFSQWGTVKRLLGTSKGTIEFDPLNVRSNVDEQLDNLKQIYDNMPQILTEHAEQQNWDFPFRIIFIAQVGYLIKVTHENLDEGQIPEDWNLGFNNYSGNYYTNQLTQSLNNEYGDIYGQIHDIQKRIIFELEAFIVENENLVKYLFWMACEIDCEWGIAKVSQHMCQPVLSSSPLVIHDGWYPLLGKNAIENDFFSFNHQRQDTPLTKVQDSKLNLVNTNHTNRCMLISGPNGSGKTVYMKHLGMMVYMAHVGLLVPAQFAQIPLVDRIICSGKDQSIYQHSSGLLQQLSNLSDIVTPGIITNRTLVLVDQIGRTTDYRQSLKLLYATVKYLTATQKQNSCLQKFLIEKERKEFSMCLSVVTTHLTEMLTSRLLEENKFIRYLTMEVENEGHHLFKIKPGLAKKGYGIRAARLIYDGQFVENAQKYWNILKSGE